MNDDSQHECGPECAPYTTVADRRLDDLPDGVHLDVVYDELEEVRSFFAVVMLALQATRSPLVIPARIAATMLDIDEREMVSSLGPEEAYSIPQIIDYAIGSEGEDGFIGEALADLFHTQLDDC